MENSSLYFQSIISQHNNKSVPLFEVFDVPPLNLISVSRSKQKPKKKILLGSLAPCGSS